MSSIGDCRHCQGWKGCPGKHWYSFGEIRWCPQQIFWILKHAETLSAGVWPSEEGIMTPQGIAETIKREGYFVKASITIGQVRYRMKRLGWRARLLAEQAINREQLRFLDDDILAAVYYIAGPPKHRKFTAWLADRTYNPKRRKDDRNIAVVST